MSIQTVVRKGRYDKQWKASSRIPLEAKGRVLTIDTWKGSRGVYTAAQAVKEVDGGDSFILYQDYSETVAKFPEVKRVTEKSITECHNEALKGIEKFVKEANEFYKAEQVN